MASPLRGTQGRHQGRISFRDSSPNDYAALSPDRLLDRTATFIGFYALNSHALDVASLPPSERKHLPHYPTAPAIFLPMIAIHRDYQRKGLGQFLLADALKHVQKVSEDIGSRFIVLDALNENAAKIYASMGFVDLPTTTGRMILNISKIGKAIEKA